MVQNSVYKSWKLDDEPNLLLKVKLEGSQASWQRTGQPFVGFIVPEESSGPSTTNQIIHQRSDYCWLFQTHRKTNKWLESKRKQSVSSSLLSHERAMNHLGKGFFIFRCHLGHNRGVKLCAGWFISEIQKEESKKNREITTSKNCWWAWTPFMGTFA